MLFVHSANIYLAAMGEHFNNNHFESIYRRIIEPADVLIKRKCFIRRVRGSEDAEALGLVVCCCGTERGE